MSGVHPFGKPVNVFKYNAQTRQAELNKAELQTIFLNKELKDRFTVIISMVGAYRKGKSFFLDNCLRYLYTVVSLNAKT